MVLSRLDFFKRKLPELFSAVAIITVLVNSGLYVYDIYTDVVLVKVRELSASEWIQTSLPDSSHLLAVPSIQWIQLGCNPLDNLHCEPLFHRCLALGLQDEGLDCRLDPKGYREGGAHRPAD